MNAVRLRCAACCAALVIWSGLAAGVRAESAAPQLTELLKKLPADSAAIRAELLRLTACVQKAL